MKKVTVNPKQFHSNGKLLITGEYLVLRGASALALPLKYGQNLRIKPLETSKELLWRTYIDNKLWFEAKFDQELNILYSTLKIVAVQLQKILKATLNFSGVSVQNLSGHEVRTDIDFDINWGFGSSSSLISNIGYWLQINPFQLLFATTNGSGYDIAAARSEQPILYHLENKAPHYQIADFNPPFKENLFFIYLGQKKKSESSVKQFSETEVDKKTVARVTQLSYETIKAANLEDFQEIIDEHNQIISDIIKQPTPKENQFRNFEGKIKPLGAWGGDFVLAATRHGKEYVKDYFGSRGKQTIFSYSELVKS